jgi:hypothetical protein
MTPPTLHVVPGITVVQWCVATCTETTESSAYKRALPGMEPKPRCYKYLKDKNIVSNFSQTQQYNYFTFILICFRQLISITSALQNAE